MSMLQLQQQSQPSMLLQQQLSSAVALTAFCAITATASIAVMISSFFYRPNLTESLQSRYHYNNNHSAQVYPLNYCQQLPSLARQQEQYTIIFAKAGHIITRITATTFTTQHSHCNGSYVFSSYQCSTNHSCPCYQCNSSHNFPNNSYLQ
jgi:hypothetical protein